MFFDISARIALVKAFPESTKERLRQLIEDVISLKGEEWVAKAIRLYALTEKDQVLQLEFREAIKNALQEIVFKAVDADNGHYEDRQITIAHLYELADLIEQWEEEDEKC